jgi:hypothetical protein
VGFVKARRKGGLLRLDLHAAEAQILLILLRELSAVVASDDLADPVVHRLYPDGYVGDAEATAEFAVLVTGSLREDRNNRIALCSAEIPPEGGRLELDSDAADRWLRVLNDLRLALGTRLGVSEDDELDESDQQVQIYHWLSAVQETLVQNLMR